MTDTNEEIEIVDSDTPIQPDTEVEIEDSVAPEQQQEESVIQESQKQAPVDEDEKQQKKHISLKTKFNQTRRELGRVANENETLKQELARLQQVSFQNQDAAMGHYDKSIELQIAQAKSEKKVALENGDLDAQLAAEEKLATAISQKTRNEEWKVQQQLIKQQKEAQQKANQQQQPQQQQQQQQMDDMPEDVANWMEQNSWFVPDSPDYNAEVAQEVQSFSEVLERKYRRMGMENELYSKQFMDEIDSYVKEQIYEQAEPEPKPAAPQRNQLNMKNVRQNVAPVGKSAKTGDGKIRQTVTLSSAEKEMAKIMNLTEQDYAKWKIKDQEKQVAKGFGPQGRTRF